MLRIGIDVGGTNTDAVIIGGDVVLAAVKAPTSPDIETGIVTAMRDVLAQAGLPASRIACVMIGTTQFANALVERRRLIPIGVIRLGLPASTAVPPFCGWPGDLRALVEGSSIILHGGYEFDGREIAPLDEAGVRQAARGFASDGVRSVAISSCFAPINPAMEQRAAAIVREEAPDTLVTLSSAFNRMGLIERENAAAMNAALAPLSTLVMSSFGRALARLDITAPFFISQNDGTLMQPASAAANPVLTFASGPTNSIRGAAFLTGLSEAVVVDIGGTTSDIGYLLNGFPRESAIAVDIGGVRTNFRTPDILSIGLGGGSVVERGDDGVRIGPRSVGYDIRSEALVFGGRTPTATDIAVARHGRQVGEPDHVAGLDARLVEEAGARIDAMLAEGIDRMKAAAGDVPVILVGGGAIIASSRMDGVAAIHVPTHAEVANAIGAAIAQVSGEVDTIIDYSDRTREEVLAEARSRAEERAVAAGAARDGLTVVETEELPLNYLPGNFARVRVKVAGDLHPRLGKAAA